MSLTLERVLPQNIDNERALLGAMMIAEEIDNRQVISEVLDVLKDCDKPFYKEVHSHIFETICNLYIGNTPIDLLTVTTELERLGHLELAGGVSNLDEIIDSCPTSRNAKYYAEEVRDAWRRRKMIYTAAMIYHKAFDPAEETDEILEEAETAILSIRRENSTPGSFIKEVLRQVFKDFVSFKPDRVCTGFKDLDDLILGFEKSDYVIVGARPSLGKSMFVLNIAINAAQVGRGVAVFSLETSKEQFVARMLSSESGVSMRSIRSASFNEYELQKLTYAASKISKMDIWVDDSSDLTPTLLRSRLNQIVQKTKISLVIIDYIQLMYAGVKVFENRQQEITFISRQVKGIAKDFGVPILVVSQLSRGPEARMDKRPTLSDLRESGSLEQDSNIVLLLYRDDYYSGGNSNELEIAVAKNRDGETGKVKLFIDTSIMKIEDLAHARERQIEQSEILL